MPAKSTRQQQPSQERATSEAKPSKAAVKQEARSGSTAPPTAIKTTLTYNGKEGNDFPGIQTSKVDVNGTPTWPANGKPITEVDIDADLAENSKPWRLPGTDQTDFFNYGFDEYTWAQYCIRQQSMTDTISEQKQQDAQMKAMFGGGGGPGGQSGNSGMPGGMPSMPGMGGGMPNPDEVMQQMISQGMNPGDMNQFMAFMSGGMGGGQGQQNQQQGGGGFGQQGGGFGGGGQKSASPFPQGQGFQPPQGPGGQSQGDQGGFPANMEGYSPQQMAMLQQQQQGGGGGQGGRGRGGRRGRGFY